MELEHRLGLYQVFLKLYEHNRSLLDEILQLENISNKSFVGIKQQYIQGVAQDKQVYLVSNLIEGRTQMLMQPQHIWTLGRDRRVAVLPISDRRVSRRHAAIRYIANEGFYLIDLNSSNGSYINGEPVYQPQLLKDGDRLRLGSLAVTFFLCNNVRTLESTPTDLLSELNSLAQKAAPSAATPEGVTSVSSTDWEISYNDEPPETSLFLSRNFSEPEVLNPPSVSKLTLPQQSQILDRFFSRQNQNISNHL